MENENDFNVALNKFLDHIQKQENEYVAKNFTDVTPQKFDIDWMRKYIRVIVYPPEQPYGRSVYCFIAHTDVSNKTLKAKKGDILKAASWKAPAKKVRGTIFTENPDEYGVNRYGANYLR